MNEPEFSIARGERRSCASCDEPHQVHVAINRRMWICVSCARSIGRVGAIIARRDAVEGEGSRG